MSLTRRSFVQAAAVSAALAGLGASAALASEEAGSSTPAASASAEGSAAPTAAADLVVVGAGAAGLAAAAKAAQEGASVVVLEAEQVAGGTTRICGGHYKFMNDAFMAGLPERTADSDAAISAVLDWEPADFGDYAEACEKCKADVEEYLAGDSTVEFDSVEYWLCLHYLGTRGTDLDGMEARADYDVVAPAYYNSGEVADWLAANGMEFSDPQPNNRGDGGPLSVEPEGQGFGMISVLEQMAEDAGAQIVYGAKATGLLTDEDGKVCGVVTESGDTYTAAKLVLLACGGYCSNGEMVAMQRVYTGIDDTAPSCEPASCDGTGIKMAQELGAQTANMSFVQFFGFPEAQMGSIETLFGKLRMSKMIVNREGERFTDDSFAFFGGGSAEAVRPICDQPSGRYFLVGDADARQALGDEYDAYLESGVVVEADTVEALAEAAGISASGLAGTVEKWNSCVEAGSDPDFGRDMSKASKVEATPFATIPMAAYAQNTMGGLVINPQGQVVGEGGAPIEGLYAAGETTGNLDGACRRHGDNFAQILYYGWLAGKTAAEA